MAEPTQHSVPNAEGNANNKGLLLKRPIRRISVRRANIQIRRFSSRAINDPRTQNIATARAFRIEDVKKLIEASAGCEHLRVYNAFNAHDGYRMYMAADKCNHHANKAEVRSMADQASPAANELLTAKEMVLKSCCHCKECNI